MLTLNVGCGIHSLISEGYVNCDIKKVANGSTFVLCDGQHLPFRERAFDRVICWHVIEHVKNPKLLLREIIRVCFGSANVRCPHRFGWKAKGPWHLSHFKASWFNKELTALGVLFTVKCNYYQKFFLLALPDELEVDIYIG